MILKEKRTKSGCSAREGRASHLHVRGASREPVRLRVIWTAESNKHVDMLVCERIVKDRERDIAV